MKEYFADLHIHIGWTEQNRPVKITASKNLTFYNILKEAYHQKGLDMIGIIDAHSPLVQAEILQYLDNGLIHEDTDGGLKYNDLTIILGAEIEIKEKNRGAAHFLCFFPFLKDMLNFSNWLKLHMKNINLSSQRLYTTTRELQAEVKINNGLFIPAHIFTPFKSVYGSCCNRIEEIVDLSMVDAVELGLSSDTYMADKLKELHQFPFLTNSDAHSLAKIAREYNKLLLDKPTFAEFRLALKGQMGRKILGNYGLDPKLGKYHQSRCAKCDSLVNDYLCENCGSSKVIKGVANRIAELADSNEGEQQINRPPYIHQVPLEFLPKLGPKTLEKLLNHFGTEMNVLHRATFEDLINVIPVDLAEKIMAAREGKLTVSTGGGGIYGKVL